MRFCHTRNAIFVMQKTASFVREGDFVPLTLYRGLVPGPRWGTSSPRPPVCGIQKILKLNYAIPRSDTTVDRAVCSAICSHLETKTLVNR